MIDLVVENDIVNVIIESVSWGTIHHGVLAHESRDTIVTDDKLHGLVIKSVLTVTVPVLMSALLSGDRLASSRQQRNEALSILSRAASFRGISGNEELSVPTHLSRLSEVRHQWGYLGLRLGGLVDFLELSLELCSRNCLPLTS